MSEEPRRGRAFWSALQLVMGLGVVALCVVARCTPVAGPTDGGLVLCQTAADCPTGFICQMNSCLKRPSFWATETTERAPGDAAVQEKPADRAKGCASDAECAQGQICAAGFCREGCRKHVDCSGGMLCIDLKCQPCTTDANCNNGELCLSGACKKGDCRENQDCPGGKLCKDNACSPCTSDAECDNLSHCKDGGCVPKSCLKDEDCKGRLCRNSECVPCTQDSECGSGKLCVSGDCRTGDCKQNQDCSNGQVCKNLQCVPCQTSEDCGQGSVCVNMACKAGDCTDDADCQGGKICKAHRCSNCTDTPECGAGRVCGNGLCVAGDCTETSQCNDGKVCLQFQCSACTDKAQCLAPNDTCHLGSCRIAVAPDPQNKALRWSDGSFAEDCAAYRFPPPKYAPATTNGVYLIKPAASGAAFQVHCDMSYAGGGWTLLMKIDGDKSTFRYSSSYWRDKKSYNPQSPDFDKTEAKLESYWTVKVQDVLLRMSDRSNNGPLRSLIVRLEANSMYDIIQPNKERLIPSGYRASRMGWKGLMDNPSLQYNCNREGFNLNLGSSGSFSELRFGIASNDQSNCSSPNSFIGIGSSRSSGAAGNYATNSPDNGYKSVKTYAYLYVRNLGAPDSSKLQDHQGAKRYADGSYGKRCLDYRVKPAAIATDGIFWIKPDGQSAAFKVFCGMTQQGGGWTLALKADGSKKTFVYRSQEWTTAKPLNPQNFDFDGKEAKLQSFSSVPFEEIIVVMFAPITNTNYRYLIASYKAASLLDVFKTNTYQPFAAPISKHMWLASVSNSRLQSNCNRSGFNSVSSSSTCSKSDGGGCARARIGIISDSSSQCDVPDSRLGIGTDGSSCNQNHDRSAGNVYLCTSSSSSKRDIAAFGMVLVR